MGKKLSKRLPAALMAVALTAVSVQFPQVNADPEAPSAAKYTEKSGIGGNTDLSIKVNYGKNSRKWYAVGTETIGNNNTLVLLADSMFTDKEYEADGSTEGYSGSDVKKYLAGLTDGTGSDDIVTAAEKEKIQQVSVRAKKPDTEDTESVENQYLYLPNATSSDENSFKVGANDIYSVLISDWKSKNINHNVSSYFWLRSAYSGSKAFIVWPSRDYVNTYSVNYEGSVVPAFNLNLSSVLFSSDAAEGTAITEGGFDNVMSFRFDGTDKVTSSCSYNNETITVSNPTSGEYLYVQWKDGETDKVKSVALNTETSYSASSFGLISFENCKIWVEKKDTNDNLVYAKVAENLHTHEKGDQVQSHSDGNCVDNEKLEYYKCTDTECNAKLDADGNELTSTEGDKTPENHKSALVKTDSVPATRTAAGSNEYWTCPDCGISYSSSEGGSVNRIGNAEALATWKTTGAGKKNAIEITNTYTLTVPADLSINNSGWNELEPVKVSGNIALDKKVKVTAASANNFTLKSGDNEIAYTLKKSETDLQLGVIEFGSEAIYAENGASQSVGVWVEDYSNKPEGNYEDTITWTAAMVAAGN